MHQSRIIEVDGVFLGAAMVLPDSQGWRIVAADQRLSSLDGTVAATMQDVRRLARQVYLATRHAPVITSQARVSDLAARH